VRGTLQEMELLQGPPRAAAEAVLDAKAQIGKLVLTVSDLADTVPEPLS
jgi:hypothetical protein